MIHNIVILTLMVLSVAALAVSAGMFATGRVTLADVVGLIEDRKTVR